MRCRLTTIHKQLFYLSMDVSIGAVTNRIGRPQRLTHFVWRLDGNPPTSRVWRTHRCLERTTDGIMKRRFLRPRDNLAIDLERQLKVSSLTLGMNSAHDAAASAWGRGLRDCFAAAKNTTGRHKAQLFLDTETRGRRKRSSPLLFHRERTRPNQSKQPRLRSGRTEHMQWVAASAKAQEDN